MKRIFLLFSILLLLPHVSLAAGIISGKVNCEGKPINGAYVYLYSKYDTGFRGPADYKAGPTANKGSFSISAAKGRYYLIAKKPVKGTLDNPAVGDYYAYYGGNPVTIGDGETINIGINCVPILTVAAKKPGDTGIRGQVFFGGKPLDRARVTLYQDGDTIFRGIGYASILTNKKGQFAFSLGPGTYYVVARKRLAGDSMGPLGVGDQFGFSPDNPVKVEKGNYTVIAINCVKKLVKVKKAGQELTLGGTVKAGETVVEGKITDKAGKPVAGVYASAYRDSMMTMKPDFISKMTGPDGTYSISLSGGGVYYIGARNTIGGPAEKGDLLGRYAGDDDHSVKLKTGDKLKDIDIVVEKVQ